MRWPLLLALSMCAATAQADLKPFTASYTADFKQLPISGNAERSLVERPDGLWRLSFNASMMVASVEETSAFREQQGHLLPEQYRYERSGLGKSKSVAHQFDWSAKKVTGHDRDKPVNLTLTQGLLDKSTYQQALQNDVASGKTSMSYQVLDGDEIEVFDFRVLGEETVRTRAGLIDAVKVERVRDPAQSKRQTTLWFAKDWDYLLVRLHQTEKDGKQYQIMLKDATVDGKAVVGRSN